MGLHCLPKYSFTRYYQYTKGEAEFHPQKIIHQFIVVYIYIFAGEWYCSYLTAASNMALGSPNLLLGDRELLKKFLGSDCLILKDLQFYK